MEMMFWNKDDESKREIKVLISELIETQEKIAIKIQKDNEQRYKETEAKLETKFDGHLKQFEAKLIKIEKDLKNQNKQDPMAKIEEQIQIEIKNLREELNKKASTTNLEI